MRVVVTGATGMIGKTLVAALRDRGDEVVALSRDPERAQQVLGDGVEAHAWTDPTGGSPPRQALAGAAVVVNLMGELIAQRWTDGAKQRIRDSRVLGTRSLVRGLGDLPDGERPRTLISQSACGFYGPRGAEELDEGAAPGSDFLAQVVGQWEQEASAATSFARVVTTRTGLVLAAEGGALAKMLPFFRVGIGGPVAGGRQYVPWVHLDDVVGAFVYSIDQSELDGPVNLTAPTPATMAELARALGRVLRRPAILPVPAIGLQLLYGEMATVVTTGQRAIPAKLERHGYEFRFRELEGALRDVLG